MAVAIGVCLARSVYMRKFTDAYLVRLSLRPKGFINPVHRHRNRNIRHLEKPASTSVGERQEPQGCRQGDRLHRLHQISAPTRPRFSSFFFFSIFANVWGSGKRR